MKVELMKQNKNSSVIRLASVSLAVIVLFFSLCVPSFAVAPTDFSAQPLPTGSVPNNVNAITESGYHFVDYMGVYPLYSLNTTAGADVYSFYYFNVSQYDLCFVSPTVNAKAYFSVRTGNSYLLYSNSTATLDSTTGLYYGGGSSYASFGSNSESLATCNIPVFSSLSAGLSSVSDWINNPPGTPAHIAVTLKPGYVGYFDISNLSNVSVSLGTSLFSGAKYPGFSTDQAIGTVSSLPSGSFSLPIAGTSSISWAGSGQKDLIGRYSSFSYSHVYTSAGGSTYLVVVNPLSGSAPVLSALGASGANRNGNITVLIDQCRGSKIYSLTESLAIGSGSLDTESNGTSVNDGVYDPDTGAWNFTDPSTGLPEDPSSLPVGGGNDPIIGGTGGNTINEWLEDIANSIKSFFSGAIGAVTTLVSSGSDFIHSLSGLYAWLPGPVYSVLVSALILVITIGVIKVFI